MHNALSYRLKRSGAGAVVRRQSDRDAAYAATLEIADRCNESCLHCYQVQGQKGEMSTAQLKQIMDELAQMGVLFLTLSGGEATLRKDFLELVAHARQLRFAVKIYSNALLIDEHMAAELGRLAVQEVQISLYSPDAQVHDGITRVPGSFAKVLRATRNLRKHGVQVLLKTPLMSINQAQATEYAQLADELDAHYMMDPFLNPREDGSAAPLEFAVTREQHIELKRHPRYQRPAGKGRKGRAVELSDRLCGACSGSVHVEANGEVRPCTQWSVATGHVLRDGGVRQAWQNNERARAIRELSWAALPGCRACDLRHYCTRCFADAQSQMGNALAPYPLACERAAWAYESRNGIRPQLEAEPGRNTQLGPYRATGAHQFRAVPYELEAGDRERLEANPWLLEPRDTDANERRDTGQLVQLRRGPSRTYGSDKFAVQSAEVHK